LIKTRRLDIEQDASLREQANRWIEALARDSVSCSSRSEDNDTPRRRTAFARGKALSSRPIDSRARSSRFATAEVTDRLRVMISKSENFTKG